MNLTKYEKETIILTSEGDTTYTVYTFDKKLKRRLADFAEKYPDICYLKYEDIEAGSQTYVVDKARMSVRITAPYTEERRRAASKYAKEKGFNSNGQS